MRSSIIYKNVETIRYVVWKSCQGFFELHFCHICLIILLYYNCIHVYINKTILLWNVIYISFRNRSKIWHICHKPITSTCPSLFAISFVPVLYLGNVYPKVISPLEVNCPSFSLFMVLFQQTWLLIDGLDAFLLVFFSQTFPSQSGFVQVMENLESHGISEFHFPCLESHGI